MVFQFKISVIDEIVFANSDCEFVANNIYALDYLSYGVSVWAGLGLNITNDYAVNYLSKMGVTQMISSIEKWAPTIKGSYKIINGHMPLMTFAHCPYKTLYKNNCSDCKFKGDIILSGNENYKIKRVKISNCYFELIDCVNISYKYSNEIVDLRKF